MSLGSSPDPPDYRGAAEEQGEANLAAINAQTFANRPDQFTPFGFSTWQPTVVRDPSTREKVTKWTQTIGLTPDQQQALNAQLGIQLGRSDLASTLMGRMGGEFGAPVTWDAMDPRAIGSGEDARQAAEDALYGRATARLDPHWEERRAATEGRLWNQGLRPGDEAWDNAMRNFDFAETDAYERASEAAVIGGGAEQERQFGMDFRQRQQAIAENLQRRGWTLNEINAILSGQQVGMPQLPGFERAGAASPTPYFQAAQAGYGADLDNFNARQMGMQGLMSGIAGTASAGAPFAFLAAGQPYYG